MRALTISANNFEDSELIDPVAALTAAGVDVDIASLAPGTITGKKGVQVQATLGVADVKAGDYDLLLLPGGKAPAELRQSERVLDLARDFMDADKPVAAICHGPQILISAERVRGRQMTSYACVASELKDAGADYRDDQVVVDGNLITSRHPGDIPLFVEQILRTLEMARASA
ncbi:type 1 glutamine amidotransferase domain-containing protein [Thiocystis violacea]|uniref:type 1 glutamine amidotransferase domain-containing protein n=1 Tax=Thiocystis violacea TaxID=13725 RepID=UPI001904681A|nr:type 1 glutamine amidotransferase domain-containing protein [Thiocystis violacea]MBK1724189.1 protease [Thiocystis violacea]